MLTFLEKKKMETHVCVFVCLYVYKHRERCEGIHIRLLTITLEDGDSGRESVTGIRRESCFSSLYFIIV